MADRLAEAFAELLHLKLRTEFWGYAKDENLTNEQLIREEYQGMRPAPGYSACPDHSEKGTIWKLLDVEKNANIHITESFAMLPTASVSGYYFARPRNYFGVGKVNKDQVENLAKNKGISASEVEKLIRPNLNY